MPLDGCEVAPAIADGVVAQRAGGARSPRIAVLVPCRDEAASIGQVVAEFRSALAQARILVFDNGSVDGSAAIAARAGAEVVAVAEPGKGNVVRHMFRSVDADLYLIVDGDGTYDPSSAPRLVDACLRDGCDMVVGARKALERSAYPPGHAWGNTMLSALCSVLFRRRCRDLMSGYRVFSRRFVETFPARSTGFEVEAEMTVHAIVSGLRCAELETPYRARPPRSRSKLRTVPDGLRVLRTLIRMFARERPVAATAGVAGVLAVLTQLSGKGY